MSTHSDYSRQPYGAPPPSSSVNVWLVLLLLAMVGLFVYQRFANLDGPLHNPDAESRKVTPRGDLAGSEKSTIELFRKCQLSVVHIRTAEFHRDRMSLERIEVAKGSGSGFIWNADGHIVTNYHVVQGAQNYYVTLHDNRTIKARFVGGYPESDIAVIKVDVPADQLVPIEIGTSGDLEVGQSVFAIGNPFGLFSQSLTTGVVSGLGRTIPAGENSVLRDLIQTDAAINPGNSGGPLLDSYGRLVGMNTAIFSPSGTNSGLGFAVPVDNVNFIVPQLIRHGRVEQPGLGVQIFPDSFVEALREQGYLPRRGVLILDVIQDGAGDAAGLKPTTRTALGYEWGDLIINIDGTEIERQRDLFELLSKHKVGDTITATVLRDGKEVSVTIKLQALERRVP